MKTFSIKQNNYLTEYEVNEITNLEKICYEFDHVSSKIYWDIIKQKFEIDSNFFCYQNDILIGYFNFFLFDEEDAVQASIMVHPDYRQHGVFDCLFHTACLEIIKSGANKIIFSFPHKQEKNRKYLYSQQMDFRGGAKRGSRRSLQIVNEQTNKRCNKPESSLAKGISALQKSFLYYEYSMERSNYTTEIIENNNLMIRNAHLKDLELMAEIDSICFNSNFTIMQQRFKETIRDPKRQVWLAYLGDICIGKIHVFFNKNGAYIHNICVIPKAQKKGFGTFLLKFVINYLLRNDSLLKMYLEVTATNESALKIYKKCGFKIINTYEYWTVTIN